MRIFSLRSAVLPLLPLAGFIFSSPAAHAQAVTGANRFYTVSTFAGYGEASTDYGPSGSDFIVGGDITRHLRLLSPSLELRYTHASNSAVTESTLGGGLKIERSYNRFVPYATVLVGHGNISLPLVGNYSHDDSVVLGGGGGVDFHLTRSFLMKVDAQYQHWNLGTNSVTLTPMMVSVGITHVLPIGAGHMSSR